MCLIIDANCAAAVCNAADEAKPVVAWLLNVRSHIAVGGSRLAREYRGMTKFLRLISQLDARGQLRRFADGEVDTRELQLEALGELESNDAHIVALAQESGARLLYSHDQPLHADFRNPQLLVPRGHVYQTADHGHLLRAAPPCRADA
jgi:hypothetical protein